jgi:hypothetical protein
MKKTLIIGIPIGPFAHAEFVKVELPNWLFWLLYVGGILILLKKFVNY